MYVYRRPEIVAKAERAKAAFENITKKARRSRVTLDGKEVRNDISWFTNCIDFARDLLDALRAEELERRIVESEVRRSHGKLRPDVQPLDCCAICRRVENRSRSRNG